jgi:tetratricopeptide (TPR) repeat protein
MALADDNARTHYYFALVERRLGHTPESITSMRRAAELDATYAAARWRLGLWLLEDGDYTAALDAAEEATALARDDRAATLVFARAHLQAGNLETAAGILESHIESRPDDNYAHFLLSGAYRRLGRNEESRRHAVLGQAAEPGWGDPWSDALQAKRTGFPAALATATQLLSSNPGRAVEQLERLREQRPENGTVLINLGIGYRVMGRLDDSANVLRDVLLLEPARGLAHFHLAVTYAQMSRDLMKDEFLEMALEHAGRAVELQPTSARCHALQGELLAQAKQIPAAVDAYRKAARDPQDAAWLNRLGELLCQLQRWQEAIPVLKSFLERVPGNVDARFLLGVAQANAGRFDDAVENLERVQQVRPGDPQIEGALLQLKRARAAAVEK